MPERPLMLLPPPAQPMKRRNRGGGGGRPHLPDRSRQKQRLGAKFDELQTALESRRARIQAEAQGLVPEDVIVLETIGAVDDFIRAVERIPGLEWLGEIEEEDIPPDDDFFELDKDGERRPDKKMRGRLFMVFTNQRALTQILAMWKDWQDGKTLPRNFGRWGKLFERLRDVRRWGVRDRLYETGILDDWRTRIDHGQEVVPCELELWFRGTARQREVARNRVADLIADQKGKLIAEATVEEIGYHALLTTLPIEAINQVLDNARDETALIQCEQIQFFRASGQAGVLLPDDKSQTAIEETAENPSKGEPVIALFDGLPMQAHERLQDRLIIDDPDDFESDYLAAERRHGTAMASLILHGDLSEREPPLERPLYIRPILKPDSRDWRQARQEMIPEDTLPVDLVHRAVRRLFEGDGDEGAVASTVVAINLSIGIQDRPFDGALSPLARLLDWLSWRYKVLFIVSAGNQTQAIELSTEKPHLSGVSPEDLQTSVIQAIAADARNRRLISPAETINGLTIGSLHDDASAGAPPQHCVDPYMSSKLPSPFNAQGMGYKRAIKPDILAPGGRVTYRERLGSTTKPTLELFQGNLPPGQCCASPGPNPGVRNAAIYTQGTSNSAALTSHAAGSLYDLLDELTSEPGGEIIDEVPRGIWIKALLGHSCEWGASQEILDDALRTGENSNKFREYITRLIGYGTIQPNLVRECTEFRATALSGGSLTSDQSHIHEFPLPPSLSGVRGLKTLKITLAWISPVNPRHQSWRRAHLWFHPDAHRPPKSNEPFTALRLKRQQADSRAAQRGTLQHEVLEGHQAAAFVDGDTLSIQVSCRPDAGVLDEEITYALISTLEVAEEIGIDIYDEIRVRVQAASVRVSATS